MQSRLLNFLNDSKKSRFLKVHVSTKTCLVNFYTNFERTFYLTSASKFDTKMYTKYKQPALFDLRISVRL